MILSKTFKASLQQSRKNIIRGYSHQPKVRDPRFAKLSDQDVSFFKSINPQMVITDKFDLEPYNEDWMKKYKGNSAIALFPKTVEEVSKIMKHCNQRKLAVVPQGGNTGLVGGSVPVFDEVILNMSRMNQISAFDSVTGVVTCQAGVVLEKLEQYLGDLGYVVPLDLGAKGSCHIGGNVATNAGGLRLLRYGSLHGNVIGLRAVLADGTILDDLNLLRKNNTGYDLKQLFIGSEGSLGIITDIALLTPQLPKAVNVVVFACERFEDVLTVFLESKKALGEILSAVEFLDRDSMDLVLKHLPGTYDPFAAPTPFYAVLETSGSNANHDKEKLTEFFTMLLEKKIIADGVMAQNMQEFKTLWKLREGISESLKREGYVYKYDFSIPSRLHYQMVEDTKKRLGNRAKVVGYGHIGDGNLHLNISCPRADPEVESLLEPWVYEWIMKESGSISAEHGLGLMKANCIKYSKNQTMIEMMRKMKNLFDPNGILNPYKVLPAAKR